MHMHTCTCIHAYMHFRAATGTRGSFRHRACLVSSQMCGSVIQMSNRHVGHVTHTWLGRFKKIDLDDRHQPSPALRFVCMYVCMCVVCMCVCMYVCVCVCMYVWVYVCMYVCVCTCMYVCMYECMYVWVYVCMCVCVCVSMYVCVYVYIHVCVYLCMYICIYVCMYVCTFVCCCISPTGCSDSGAPVRTTRCVHLYADVCASAHGNSYIYTRIYYILLGLRAAASQRQLTSYTHTRAHTHTRTDLIHASWLSPACRGNSACCLPLPFEWTVALHGEQQVW